MQLEPSEYDEAQQSIAVLRTRSILLPVYVNTFKYEAQTALFKDPVRTEQ